MKDWIQAARLRTLPLSVSGIIVGAFIARWRLLSEGGFWDWRLLVGALLVTLFYQVLSNFANDYGDGVKGTDAKRSAEAETRAVASGRISARQMKKAVILFALLSALSTIALLYMAFFQAGFFREFYVFLGLGAACILAAIGYTVGKKPYGYLGLGDLMVFLFFGLVSVGGSYFLFTKTLDWDLLLPSAAIGLLSTAVLNLNNMRDIRSDAESGKKTLALRLGYGKAMVYQMILLQLPHILILIFLFINEVYTSGNYYAFIVMVMLFPTAALRRRILQTKEPKALDPFLKQVGVITLSTALLLAAGLNFFKG
ncbi:1,4-dihydroxy-2-naphthoate octaprenyltransferase [Bergeyella sp. RCAD1439]|uniref:1,4-dihydroxy-2-naphthoate octaprenyltransferase n=1 Tax=Bergeyella anatis TaxID=3113737 RepID=UPI002E1970B0|nr:1,4-dihydroxy-2-naphthoate octaprenyltransferase [Bergeyella sp. RCAD1439]